MKYIIVLKIYLGPPKLPFVGSLPFLGPKNSLLHILKFIVDKYGTIAGFYLGSQPTIVITDFNVVKGQTDVNPQISTLLKVRLTLIKLFGS